MPAILGQFVGPAMPLLAWAGAGAMAVPIVIHLLTRMRRRPQTWGAMRFLLEAYRRHRTRLRLEQYLLLLVRCLILGVLGLALSGPAWRGCSEAAARRGSGRLVYLVVDDSLSTQAVALDGRPRFERQRDAALRIVDGLSPNDRVAVWRSAWPSSSLSPRDTLDHEEVRRQLEQLKPRYSRADTLAALDSVNARLRQSAVSPARAILIVLSDWGRDALKLSQPPAAGLVDLAGRCRILITRPAPRADNFQVAAAMPRRFVILTEPDGSAVVPVSVKLNRYGSDDEARSTISVGVWSDEDRREDRWVKREVRWPRGQAEAAVSADVEVPAPGTGAGGVDRRLVSVWVRLEDMAVDALEADDHRWAVVELRHQIRVGLVDRFEVLPDSGRLLPRQWLSIALAPAAFDVGSGLEESRTELIRVEAAELDAPAVKGLDVVIVLRPDLVGQDGWRALGAFVQRGGLIWFFVPADEGTAVWAKALREQLGLDWNVGLEALDLPSEDGQGIPLASTTSVPEPLDLLAADWSSLLRPVRLKRCFELSVSGGPQEQWLVTADQRPLLVSTNVGLGRVMLMASAIDPDWTNLPTKPLFVPLLHESLRSGLGGSKPPAEQTLVCGVQPRLGEKWAVSQRLVSDSGQVRIQRDEQSVRAVDQLEEPGIYHAEANTGLKLAVNIEAEAGDTRVLQDDALRQWFSGGWDWLDVEDPARVLSMGVPLMLLGWPLLWTVLALVLIETALARWFSHARSGRPRALRARFGRLVARFEG